MTEYWSQELTWRQNKFKGHVHSHFINYMNRSTSKPSNRRWPQLNLPQCSLKLFQIFIRCCCVLWQYFVKQICFDRSVVTLYGRASIPSYPRFASLLRILYFQLTLWEKNYVREIFMSIFSTRSMTMWFSGAFISQTITFIWLTLMSSTCLNPCLLHNEKMRPLSTNNSLQWFDHSIVLSFLLRAWRNSKQRKIRL